MNCCSPDPLSKIITHTIRYSYHKYILMGISQRCFVSVIFLIPAMFLHSQTVSDTLNRAKKLRAEGKIHKSYLLLKETYRVHPDNLNVAWLTAQTAFWANRIAKSKRIYEKAVKDNPKNLYLQLDYAKMLVNSGDFEKGEIFLNNYLSYDSTNAQALTYLAKISFWRCNYEDADKLVSKAIRHDPKVPDASALREDIALARAPYLKLGAGYTSDDQPMQTVTPLVGAGIYLSALSSLHFSFQTPFFIRDGKTDPALLFSAGNTSFISKANLTIGLDAGVVKFPVKNSYAFTGNISLDKIFIRHLEISLSAQRNPYFSTLSSIDTMVIQNHLTFSAGWNNLNSWNGEAAIEAFTYPLDKNVTYSSYLWAFAPPVKFSVFQLRFGYAYNYSDSKKDHYVAEKSLPDIISSFDANSSIAGIYEPYFTPEQQQIHSFLLSFTGHPLKWMDFSIHANAGIYATTHAPYLYLDKDAKDSVVLKTGFTQTRFYPATVEVQILMKLSERIHLQADYTFRSTYFYTSNYAGIGLNIRFLNEKKSKKRS
jgi:tetratricopeptide (TPR) repeat protein